ncbi:hypothetical protein BH11PLA2_BH11PLA2_52150 [soil metagenome]
MAQTYTLDEAASKLGLPTDEFKRRWKTEWTTVRTFRDGGTVRFRSADIDELARTLGMASDPGVQLSSSPGSSTDYLLPSEDAVGDDIFSVNTSDSARRKNAKPADSDIRLEADAGPKSNRRRAAEMQATEELSIDLSMPESGKQKKSGQSSKKLSAPKTGPNLSKPGKAESDSSSEFELSLDSDSDSFELTLNPDGSDEVDLGGSTVDKRGGSGINLARPADSGVSLESDDDMELSLDEEPTTNSGRKLTGPKSVKMPRVDAEHSDSEFELTLDDNSGLQDAMAEDAQQGDIFETDFELPASDDSDLESGSEVVAVEGSDTDLENSDFDLALDESDIQSEDESASQVVLLDDEDDAPRGGKSGKLGKAAKSKRSLLDDEEDNAIDLDDDDASSQLRNVPRRQVDDEEDSAAPIGAYKPKPWGILPAIVLLPAFLLTFLGGLMSYELLRGMWSYNHGTKPGGSLVRGVADMFDMKTTD